MRAALRAGAAVYNDGHYHAAHDAWAERWLELESGTHDELLLHGLIQFTAAVHHAHERNWEGTVGLAESAGEYLEGLPETYRTVDLAAVRAYLEELATDPEVIERRDPIDLRVGEDAPGLADLGLEEGVIAAGVLAEELGLAPEPIELAGEFALADLEDGRDDSQFIPLVRDFILRDDHRGLVHERLTAHVERRRAIEEDVGGLFEGE